MNRFRYLICPLLLSGLLAGRPLLAQDTTRQFMRPALLKTNLLYPFMLSVEVPTTPRQSFQFNAHYFGMKGTSSMLFTPGTQFSRERNVNITPEYRFYLSRSTGSARRPAPRGLYLGPYLTYHYEYQFTSTKWQGTTGINERTESISSFGGGVVVGVQFITRGGFVIDGFLGRGYFPVVNYQPTQENILNRDQNDFRFGLSIGGAFSRPGTHRRTQK